jgi:hypothetical protein
MYTYIYTYIYVYIILTVAVVFALAFVLMLSDKFSLVLVQHYHCIPKGVYINKQIRE